LPIRAVLLDLDGTLMDTVCEIDTALAHAFREEGIEPLARADVVALVGKGVRSLVERALAHRRAQHVDIDAMVGRFESHYDACVATEALPYPGCADGVRTLHAHGFRLGVVTNKPRVFTERLLGSTGVADLLAAVVAGDDGIPRKPAGDMLAAACARMETIPAETLMVGDSINDVLAARAAGCPVWCVRHGYNEGQGADALEADRLVDSVAEAARLLIAAADKRDLAAR
jgi:phosphoglycolate phosphatase